MQESDADVTSSDDEEYVPPCKSRKRDSSGDSTSDSESEYSDDDDASVKNPKKGSKCTGKLGDTTNHSAESAEEERAAKREKEDKIWNEFLNSEEPSRKPVVSESSTVVKRYQFAGEDVEVIETIKTQSETSSKTPTASATCHKQNGKSDSINSIPNIPKIGATKSSLSNALSNLRSLTSGKPPKLSTLEKSRLDWENFIKKEDIEHDLKSHNKSKGSYLERQAFVNRTSEREYQYKRNLESTSNRRKP